MSVTAEARAAAGSNAVALDELRCFLEHEADLLDDRRFDEWCDLYTEDAIYWVPAAPEQESWHDHVSLFYDDKATMRVASSGSIIPASTARARRPAACAWSRASGSTR